MHTVCYICRINNIANLASYSNTGVGEIESILFDGAGDGGYNGVGLVEIS